MLIDETAEIEMAYVHKRNRKCLAPPDCGFDDAAADDDDIPEPVKLVTRENASFSLEKPYIYRGTISSSTDEFYFHVYESTMTVNKKR